MFLNIVSLSTLWDDHEGFYHGNANTLKFHIRCLKPIWPLSISSYFQNWQNKLCSSHCGSSWFLSHAKFTPASGPLHLLDDCPSNSLKTAPSLPLCLCTKSPYQTHLPIIIHMNISISLFLLYLSRQLSSTPPILHIYLLLFFVSSARLILHMCGHFAYFILSSLPASRGVQGEGTGCPWNILTE